jgi:hypothetical protein
VGVRAGGGGTCGREAVNLKAFLVDALGNALELGLGTPDDVLRFVTPDVLSNHLPRPLWARLFTACLGASKVDAQLVVDTIGVPNLCEHMPSDLIWSSIAAIASKSLGGVSAVAIPSAPQIVTRSQTPARGIPAASTPAKGVPVAAAATPAKGVPLTPPPPAATPPAEAPTRPTPTGVLKTTIPAPGASPSASLANLDLDDEPSGAPSRARTPTGQRFRQAQSGLSRMAAATAAARRPQAQAPAPQPAVIPPKGTSPGTTPRRGAADLAELETETSVGEKDWDQEINVDEDQLVDWQSSEETVAGGENLTRKR